VSIICESSASTRQKPLLSKSSPAVPVATSVAAGIGELLSGGPVNLTTRLSATAVAAEPKMTLAQLSIRSTLVGADTVQDLTC
jgi:hypothetical protein